MSGPKLELNFSGYGITGAIDILAAIKSIKGLPPEVPNHTWTENNSGWSLRTQQNNEVASLAKTSDDDRFSLKIHGANCRIEKNGYLPDLIDVLKAYLT